MRALLALLLAQAAPAQMPAPPPPARVDAREQVPSALIGAWKLAPSESKFGARAPKMQYRFFEYTADGMLLAQYLTLGATGTIAAGNWTSALDQSFRPEYTRGFGSTVYAMVQLTKRDERTFDLKAAKAGTVFETGQFVLSPDGRTLTFTYVAGGQTVTSVYHPWNLLD